jgi:hypothetical protein
MASPGILRRVALVRTDVSEELSESIIGVTRVGELGSILSVNSNRRTLRRNTKYTSNTSPPILVTLIMEEVRFSETSVLTRVTRHIPEDGILHRHRRENFNSYKALTGWSL